MKRAILLNALACSALLLGGCAGKASTDSAKNGGKSDEPHKINAWSSEAEIAAAEAAKDAKKKAPPAKTAASDAPAVNAWSTDEDIAEAQAAKDKKKKPAAAKAPPKDAPPKLNAWSTDQALAAAEEAEASKKKKK